MEQSKKSTLKEQSDPEVRKSRLQETVSPLLADCLAVWCYINKTGLDNRKRGMLVYLVVAAASLSKSFDGRG